MLRNCTECHKEFNTRSGTQITCGGVCAKKMYNRGKREWERTNPERNRLAKREAQRRRLANPEYRDKIRVKRRAYRLANIDRFRAQQRKYRQGPTYKSGHKRLKLRFQILALYKFTCQYCGRTPQADGIKLEVDHVHPKSKGGANSLDNYTVACKDCNLGKGDSILNELI